MPDAGGRHTQSSANLPLLIPKPEKNPCRKARVLGEGSGACTGEEGFQQRRHRLQQSAVFVCHAHQPRFSAARGDGTEREHMAGDDVLFYGSEPKILLGVL